MEKNLNNGNVKSCDSLPLKVKLAYGLSGYSSFITWTIFSLYGLYFFTDTVGFSAVFASAIISLGTLWDAVTDPIIGAWSDNRVSSKGRRRPLIIGVAIPFCLISILLFTNFAFDESITKVYYIIIILAYYTAQTVLDISCSALGPEMTLDYDERSSLASYKNFFCMLVVIIVSPTLVFVSKIGWTGTLAIYMAFALLCILTVWHTTKGYEKHQNNEKIEFKNFGEIFKNKPARIIMLMFGLGVFGNTFNLSMQVYYFSYYVKLSEAQIGSVLMVGGIAACIGVPFVDFLCRKLSKKAAWVISLGTEAVAVVLFIGFIITPGNIIAVYIWFILIALGICAIYQVPWSMIPDCVEINQLISNKRIEGLIFGLIAFIQKVAAALAIAAVGVGLTLIGYTANGIQSVATLQSLKWLYTFGVGIPFVIAIVAVLLYPLSKKRHQEVLSAIERQKDGQSVDISRFKDLISIKK